MIPIKNESKKFIDRDIIKYLAIIPMAIGHFCGYLTDGMLYKDMPLPVFLLMQLAVFAPPIFFFFIAEGFRYTRSRKKYALRLFLFALINQVPFCLANYGTLLTRDFFTLWNIIFTLFLGLICLIVWESKWKLPVRIIVIVLLDLLTVLIQSEWMIFGIPIILGFHIFHNKPKAQFIWFTSCILLQTIILNTFNFSGWKWTLATALIPFISMMAAYLLIIKQYNGQKGKHSVFSKWFFYLFYPLHLFAIYLIKFQILAG